jgi:hypothetical protein
MIECYTAHLSYLAQVGDQRQVCMNTAVDFRVS